MDGRVYGAQLEVELVAITPDLQRVIGQGGRTCYLSFERMDEGSQADFIRRLIKVGQSPTATEAR